MTSPSNESSARREFERIVERARAAPHVTDALTETRSHSYFWSRTRLALPRALQRALLGTLELYLLAQILPWDLLPPFFFLRGVTWLASGMHWGWLEGLRSSIRENHRARRFGEMKRVTASWLLGSAGLGVTAFAAATAWIVWMPFAAGFSVFDAFALACAFRFSIEALARTYHASLYAVRRIHRPLWSLLLPDAIEPLGLIVTFPSLGLWSFVLWTAVAAIARAAAQAHFTRKSLDRARLGGGVRRRFREARFADLQLRASLPPAFANAAAQIDSLLLITLTALGNPQLAALLYWARPLFAGVQGALRGFYFDLKWLEPRVPEVLIRRFRESLQWWAAYLGTTVGFAVSGALLLYGERDDRLLSLFPLFGVARSLFALKQVRAFADAHFAWFAWLTPLGLGLIALPFLPIDARDLSSSALLAASAAALGALALLPDRSARSAASRSGWMHRDAWLPFVATSGRGTLVFGETRSPPLVARPALSTALSDAMPGAAWSWLGKNRWAAWCDEDHDEAALRMQLARHGGGATHGWRFSRHASGKAALESGAWPTEIAARIQAASSAPATPHEELTAWLEEAGARVQSTEERGDPALSRAIARLYRSPPGNRGGLALVTFPLGSSDPLWFVELPEKNRDVVRARLEVESLRRALTKDSLP